MTILIEYLQYPFFVRAMIVGGIIGLILSWMSGYIVMRREVVLTHALSHLGFLGIAFAILFSLPITLSLIGMCLIGIYLIYLVRNENLFYSDSLLEIFAQLSLALAVVVISFFPGYRINIEQFLFGDILGISKADLWMSLVLLFFVGGILLVFHKTFLKISLSDILSHTLVRHKKFWNGLLLIIFALMIALAIRVVGVLLVAAFVTIPSNSAKLITKNITASFVVSALIGTFCTFTGLFISAFWDIPTGAMIVLLMGIFWLFTILWRKLKCY